MTDTNQVYNGNKSTDFQPATQDPQTTVGTNLQPVSTDVQPIGNDNTVPQQSLPQVSELKVVAEGTSSSIAPPTTVTPVPQRHFSWGLIIVLIIVGLLGLIMFRLSKLATKEIEPEIIEDASESTPPTAPKKTKKSKGKKTRRARRS